MKRRVQPCYFLYFLVLILPEVLIAVEISLRGEEPWRFSLLPDSDWVRPLQHWNLSAEDSCQLNNTTIHDLCDIPARVPADLLTDLMRAGLIQDPYFNRNWLTQRHVWMGSPRHPDDRQRRRTWIYSTRFNLPDHLIDKYLLVSESIKMGARVELNGVLLGTATNQFRRYIFNLTPDALLRGLSLSNGQRRHDLKIVFDPEISTDGRFMACSGGWDWAPYSRSLDSRGSRILTLGLPKAIHVVAVRKVIVTDVVPKVYYLGDYPDAPLWNGPLGDFLVSIELYFQIFDRTALDEYSVFVHSDVFHQPLLAPLALSNGTSMIVNVTVARDNIELWWPNGMGNQSLYSLKVTLDDGTCNQHGSCLTLRRRIGFRTVALVTANDTDPIELANLKQNNPQGSGGHGMYYRINGAVVWARGANVVPMDQLEGRLSNAAHTEMVRSAAKANMNMLRIWGGGSVLPRAFYDACDEYGILLFHDLMFVEEGSHGALQTSEVREEIIDTLRRLASYPSIITWNGCNECSGSAEQMRVYESFVMATVAEIDDTRPIWASSPSPYGWARGVNMLDGRPNGDVLIVRYWNSTSSTANRHVLESHGPYQRGFSELFPAVNGRRLSNANESLVPPNLHKGDGSGAGYKSTFVSEFGATGYSSFESMSAFLPCVSWSAHGGGPPDQCVQAFENENTCVGVNVMAERNYPCDSRIDLYFGNETSLDAVGETAFQRQLYECMMAQLLWMKGRVEMMRSTNSFGALIWQLNENWPTGGWASVEYGPDSQSAGQLLGGRWKPLMYLLMRLFRDNIVACGEDGLCVSRHDNLHASEERVAFEAWRLDQTQPLRLHSWNGTHGEGRSTVYFNLPDDFLENADVVLLQWLDLCAADTLGEPEAFLWKVPREMNRLSLPISFLVSVRVLPGCGSLQLEVRSDRLALYVFLSTAAKGRFLENAFHLRPGQSVMVAFESIVAHGPIDVELFRRTLRVHHLGKTSLLDVKLQSIETAIL